MKTSKPLLLHLEQRMLATSDFSTHGALSLLHEYLVVAARSQVDGERVEQTLKRSGWDVARRCEDVGASDIAQAPSLVIAIYRLLVGQTATNERQRECWRTLAELAHEWLARNTMKASESAAIWCEICALRRLESSMAHANVSRAALEARASRLDKEIQALRHFILENSTLPPLLLETLSNALEGHTQLSQDVAISLAMLDEDAVGWLEQVQENIVKLFPQEIRHAASRPDFFDENIPLLDAAASTRETFHQRGVYNPPGRYQGSCSFAFEPRYSGAASELIIHWDHEMRHPPGWVLYFFLGDSEEPISSFVLGPDARGSLNLTPEELGFDPTTMLFSFTFEALPWSD